jgi:metal transporter CNNM
VKIKTTPNRSASGQELLAFQGSPIIEVPYEDNIHGGEGEGLLRSGGSDAKDGVQALQQGYGSISRSLAGPPKTVSQTDSYSGMPLVVDGTSKSKSPERGALSRHSSQDSGRSSDTLGSLHSGSYGAQRKKGVARSGSITENIIEAGGVRKVVLETNSSSDGDRDEVRNGKTTSSTFLPVTEGQSGSQGDGDAPKSEEVKKKRRRTRKKKSAKSGGEETSAAGGSAL